MKRIVEFMLEDGGSILVEVDQSEDITDIITAGNADEAILKASQTFENAIEKIKPAATIIISKLRSISEAPDEVEVEFGLSLSAEAGAFIASTGVEANYKITLKWSKK